MRRFLALDALRCILALCVALGHLGLPPIFGPVGEPDQALDLLARAWRTFAFGPPAVIAFFLISGFCIHYPFAERGEGSPLGRFYARRYLRIVAPAACTIALFKVVDPNTVLFGEGSILFHSTLWSIACEEIYYAVYPALNRLGRAFGWGRLLAASLAPMALVGWYYFPAVDWNELGVIPTTLMLFPVWLGGCYLAERISTDRGACSARQIWAWRAAAWLVMWSALMLQFQTSLHQTITAPAIGAIYYFWIRAELRYYRTREPWPVLVWGGRWSYSLYLVHPIAIAVAARYAPAAAASPFGWFLVMGGVLAFAYLFYLLVERPSHNLARRIPLFARPAQASGLSSAPVA